MSFEAFARVCRDAERWAEVYRDLRDRLENIAGRDTRTDLTVSPEEVRLAKAVLAEHDEFREASREDT